MSPAKEWGDGLRRWPVLWLRGPIDE